MLLIVLAQRYKAINILLKICMSNLLLLLIGLLLSVSAISIHRDPVPRKVTFIKICYRGCVIGRFSKITRKPGVCSKPEFCTNGSKRYLTGSQYSGITVILFLTANYTAPVTFQWMWHRFRWVGILSNGLMTFPFIHTWEGSVTGCTLTGPVKLIKIKYIIFNSRKGSIIGCGPSWSAEG